MKQKIIIILCALVLIGVSNTGGSMGTPDVTTATWLNIPFEATDTTTGVGRTPDSVSVITFFGNCGNAGIFQVSSASLDSTWWDSTQTGAGVGRKINYFRMPVANLDADSGAGLYTGVINAWFQGYPMPTYFSFMLYGEAAHNSHTLTLYVGGADSSYANDGLSWKTAKGNLNEALESCTGYSKYIINLAAQTFTDVCCTVDVANVSIVGAGREKTILEQKASNHTIRVNVSGHAGFTLTGVRLKGTDGTLLAGVQVVDGDYFEIYGCNFDNCDVGIKLDLLPTFGRIYDNYMFNMDDDGIRCQASNILIYDNVIDSLRNASADGIAFIFDATNTHDNYAFRNFARTSQGYSIHSQSSTNRNWIWNNWAWNDEDANTYTLGGFTVGINNHEVSQITANNTQEEDIHYSPRSANTDSGYTAGRASSIDDLVIWNMAGDAWEKHLWPAGSGSKDSVDVWDGPRESGNKKATIYFYHTGAIIDSVRTEIW